MEWDGEEEKESYILKKKKKRILRLNNSEWAVSSLYIPGAQLLQS